MHNCVVVCSINNTAMAATTSPFNLDEFIERLMAVGATKPFKHDIAKIEELEELSKPVPAGLKPPAPTSRPVTGLELITLCHLAREVFLSQPMFLEIGAPIAICGDIHGQFYDLLRIFKDVGQPGTTNYLFMGDYVDRGYYSIETLSLLLALKIKYPTRFFMLRGNHECASITRMYGFYDDCKRHHGPKLWKTCCDVFNCLPVAAVVGERIFVAHGGISPDLVRFDQIKGLQRPSDVPDAGVMCDLLWADPARTEEEKDGWHVNGVRGVSYVYGKDVTEAFLKKHDLDLICRAHEVVQDGYQFHHDRRVVTVFSAPNYCGSWLNAGATLLVDETLTCRFKILKPLDWSPVAD